MTTLLQTLQRRASETPERKLFEFSDYRGGRKHLTFGDLERRASAVAATLQHHILPGDRVIVALEPGLDYAVALFGVLLAGAVAVPAYPPGPDHDCRRRRQLQAIADDCSPRAIIAEGLPVCDALREAVHLAPGQVAAGLEHLYKDAAVSDGALAILQYTSGSTGAPKGVMISHANLHANVCDVAASGDLCEDDVQVLWLPPYHDMGLVGGLFLPVHAGFRCILTSPLFFLKRPADWLRLMSSASASVTAAPTFAYAMAAESVTDEQLKGLDLSHVRLACVSAEPIREAALNAFAERFAPAGFDPSAFLAAYGLAEHTVLCSASKRGSGVQFEGGEATGHSEKVGRKRRANCGRPVRSSEVLIVDPNTLSRCPEGQGGEIWIRGPSVAGGYWQKPAATLATFHGRAGDAEGVFLRTGDLGYLQGGDLFVFGRLSDRLIVHGRNIHAEDVEAAVLAAGAGGDAAGAAAFIVTGSDDADTVVLLVEAGQRDRELPFENLVDEIRRAVRRALELELDVLWLLRPRALPRTDSGKIRRREARAQYLSGALTPRRTWNDNVKPSGKLPNVGADEF